MEKVLYWINIECDRQKHEMRGRKQEKFQKANKKKQKGVKRQKGYVSKNFFGSFCFVLKEDIW